MAKSAHTIREVGNWIVGTPLGKGGQGGVYRAASKEEPIKFDFAIKISNQGQSSAPGRTPEKDRARFLQEVQVLEAARDAGCPGIVQLVDANTSLKASPLWYVMKVLQAGPLRKSRNPPSYIEPFKGNIDRSLDVVAAVADTLGFLHEDLAYTVTHRDVKTENILLGTVGGKPFLGDPGIAHVGSYDAPAKAQTGYNEALGPQRWRPPELAVGAGEKNNPSSDVYMLGGVLYELLSGGRDFTVAVHPGNKYSHESEGFSLSEVTDDPRVPHINKLLRQMFAFDPSERISAKQVAAACRAIKEWSPNQSEPRWQAVNDERAKLLRKVREIRGVDWRRQVRKELYSDLQSLAVELYVMSHENGLTRQIDVMGQARWGLVTEMYPDFEWGGMQALINYSFPEQDLRFFYQMRDVPVGRSANGREMVLGITFSPRQEPEKIEVLYETYAGDLESRRIIRERIEKEMRELDVLFDTWLREQAKS